MTRPRFQRSPGFDNLETRQLLSGMAAPSAQQQYMLSLVNQARMNPQAAALQVTSNLTPDVQATLNYYHVDLNATKQAIASSPVKPPLAWNPSLAAAAQAHSQDMVANQYQSHTGSNGSSADQRMQQAGYANAKSTGENAYAYSSSVDEAMQAFLLDWGVSDQGHRRNLLQANVSSQDSFKDVGIGIATTPANSKVGPVVITQDFGSQPNAQAQLLGIAYSDNQNSGQYSIGEGQGNVQIDATNLATGQTTTTQTWDAGGYQMSLAPGRYQVTASVNGSVVKTSSLNIGADNVEQDFLLNQPWDGRSRDQVINAVTPNTVRLNTYAAVTAPNPTAATPPTPATQPVAVTPPPQATPFAVASTVNSTPSFVGKWTSWMAQRA